MKEITVQARINAPIEKVWEYYTEPHHITKWNNASEDWYTPWAKNEVHVGGTFVSRMEARDGSAGFDFKGTYTEVKKHAVLAYTMEDGRMARITFASHGTHTDVVVTFDPESENPLEMQRDGWQAILNNFKHYVETS